MVTSVEPRVPLMSFNSIPSSISKRPVLYRAPTMGQWYLIPWDMELTYSDVNAFSMPGSPTQTWRNGTFPEVERMLNHPPIKRMYYARTISATLPRSLSMGTSMA